MADQGGEISLFQVIHARIDTEIDISIAIKPLTTKSGKQIYLEELKQLRLIKQVPVT